MLYHLAHLNIAKLKAPIEDPSIAEFKEGIEIINNLAECSPGFIWRLKDEEQNISESSYKIMNDDMIIFTLSVWKDWKSLKSFTYHSRHSDYYRKRKKWFEKLDSHHYVLWYVMCGHIPTLAEGMSRLKFLNKKGDTEKAFTFKSADRWLPPYSGVS